MNVSSEHLSEEELLSKVEQAEKLVEVGAVYTHYRNPQSRYKVTGLSIIEATQEVGVVYKKEFGTKAIQSIVWIRPLSSWLDKVDVEKELVQRFKKVE